jgi:hypothetical protein
MRKIMASNILSNGVSSVSENYRGHVYVVHQANQVPWIIYKYISQHQLEIRSSCIMKRRFKQ